jgi:hypothetical protein
MESKTTRRVLGLLATAAIGSAAMTAFAASASAAAGTAAGSRVTTACTSAQGKVNGHVVTSYDITGGNDSTQGVPGGTLQVWASDQCHTLWAKTVKLPENADKAHLTVASISYFDGKTQQWIAKRAEQTTSADLESPAVPSTRGGEFPVEGGFVGTFYQFDSAHTYQY